MYFEGEFTVKLSLKVNRDLLFIYIDVSNLNSVVFFSFFFAQDEDG